MPNHLVEAGVSNHIARSPIADRSITRFEHLFVWAGGALFVASLAFCAWWYLVVLARPAGGSVWPALAYDAALFTAFAAHHSLFARDAVKARVAQLVPQPLVRSLFVWIASILFIAVCALWRPIGGELYDASGVRAWLHAGVQLAGLWLMAGAVRAIDALELAGIRHGSTGGELQITGPYRWVRHPVYLGWMLMVFGAGHMTAGRLTFAAISSLYLVAAIPWEERSLEREFPGAYRAYQQRVKWRVVPYVY
jgi:protein-S-isoprenylcysteine O-methyltransferase Ste14